MASLQPSSLSSLNSAALFPTQNRRSNSTFRVSCSNDDRAKLAIERARAYKEALKSKNKQNPGSEGKSEKKEESKNITVEGKTEKKEEPMKLTVSSVDFMGLDFADKKKYTGLPPGLRPIEDPYSEYDVYPEVEIIVGDPSKFPGGKRSESKAQTTEVRQGTEEDGSEEEEELYKPKVTTWGVFPRPKNISKTYGGGRTIQPGDVLETEEERAAKEERSRKLLSAYNRKIGIEIDPQLKAECQKALDEGNSLMDSGYLKESLPFYDEVMEKMAFTTELHGLAALQWAICQDSLLSHTEARLMYRKLQSHPNQDVKRSAINFTESFQAIEFMKTTGPNPLLNFGYENYWGSYFSKISRVPVIQVVNQAEEEEEDVTSQILAYMAFLVSPIFMVLFIAAKKGT